MWKHWEGCQRAFQKRHLKLLPYINKHVLLANSHAHGAQVSIYRQTTPPSSVPCAPMLANYKKEESIPPCSPSRQMDFSDIRCRCAWQPLEQGRGSSQPAFSASDTKQIMEITTFHRAAGAALLRAEDALTTHPHSRPAVAPWALLLWGQLNLPHLLIIPFFFFWFFTASGFEKLISTKYSQKDVIWAIGPSLLEITGSFSNSGKANY